MVKKEAYTELESAEANVISQLMLAEQLRNKAVRCAVGLLQLGTMPTKDGETMTENEIRQLVKDTVRETVSELRNQRVGIEDTERTYRRMSDKLYAYFAGADYDEILEQALESLEGDRYFVLLTAYYGEHKTVGQIAKEMRATKRTIHNNKKRLCLAIAEAMGER